MYVHAQRDTVKIYHIFRSAYSHLTGASSELLSLLTVMADNQVNPTDDGTSSIALATRKIDSSTFEVLAVDMNVERQGPSVVSGKFNCKFFKILSDDVST